MTDPQAKALRQQFSTETLRCSMHGAYEAKIVIVAGRPIRSQCPQCVVNQRHLALAQEAQRARDAVIGRLTAARIPKRFAEKSLDDFHATAPEQIQALKVAEKYVAQWEKVGELGTSLIFCGSVGTGKTMLACGILRAVIEKYSVTGQYVTALNAVRRIKATWGNATAEHVSETEEQAIRAWVNLDLLVLDEVGVQFGTKAEEVLLFDILNGRSAEVRPTIVIANDDLAGMERYLGKRVISRLKEGGGYVVACSWEDYREGGGDGS